jgi:isoleucyl-tRNA synthetase
VHEAGRLLSRFFDDLSNWYVRRSRRRFWYGDAAALATLHEAVTTVTLLMAPITPFITEQIWQDLVVPTGSDAPASVHLATYPAADESLIDGTLSAQTALVRRLVELGRAARANAAVKIRQPLSAALASAPGFEDLPADLLAEMAAELNVGLVTSVSVTAGRLVDTTAKANFRTLGKRFGPLVKAVAAAIAAADATSLKESLDRTGSASITVDGSAITIGPDEVVITEKPLEGWAVSYDAGATVALDLRITPELHRSGLAREAVRDIQEARKVSGLEITDRIALRYEAADPQLLAAMSEHRALIADEVLATDFAAGTPSWPDAKQFSDESLGLTFWLSRQATASGRK